MSFVVLCGSKSWFLILKRRLYIESVGNWGELHNEELQNINFSFNIMVIKH
jgi:hypothetical protein